MSQCLNQTVVPWTGGGRAPCYNGLVPDREVGVKDVQRVTTAIRLWVWTRKHSSQHKEFTPKHAAAVVGQRRDLPLGLEEKGGGEREETIADYIKGSRLNQFSDLYFSSQIPVDGFGLENIQYKKKTPTLY